MSTTLSPAPSTLHEPSKPIFLDAWYTRCPTLTAFSLAIQLGWLEDEFAGEEGILFRALQTTNDPKIHQSHYAHTQPNSFRHGGSYPAVWAQSNGSNTRVIGLSSTPAPQRILALPNSGIKSAADLKGKRLLVVRRPKEDIDFISASTLRTYEIALASAGLTFQDVTLVDHNIERSLVSDRVQHGSPKYVTFSKNKRTGRGTENIWGLLNREADVIVGPENFVEILGLDIVFDSSELPENTNTSNNGTPQTFAVNAELIEQRPDFVARVYVRALQAVEWAKNNRSEALRIVAREQGRTELQVEETFGKNFPAVFEVGLDPKNIEGLRTVKDFALRHGYLKKDFSVDAWIDPRPLQVAKKLLEERRQTAKYRAEVAARPSVIRE
jgi:ABC-type nitrate/sulfonate/bicarbonate transport system substrate-binding protein